MSTVPPPPPGMPMQPYPVPQKKSRVLMWVLIILGSLFVMVMLLIAGGVYYIKHKMNQAGISAELMRRNPALAGVRIAAAMNPSIEVVSLDEDKQTVTIRDRKTGKVSTVNFDNAKNGRWSITEDGKKVDISSTGTGPNGTVEMKGPDGSVKMGGGATDVPSWVPQYPGSTPENAFSSNQQNESGGVFHYKTKDSTEAIIKFYTEHIQEQGLKVTNTTTSQASGTTSGVLTAQDDEGKRTLSVGITGEDGQNGVTVSYATKK